MVGVVDFRSMDDATWTAAVGALRDQGLLSLATVIPRPSWEAADVDEEHPLHDLLRLRSLRGPTAYARVTNSALGRIDAWSKAGNSDAWGGWWSGKLRMLEGTPSHAAGVLAEIRAFGAMLSTSGNIVHEDVDPHTDRRNKAPDFRIEKKNVYVEVCAARINEHESKRQGQLEKEQAVLRERARCAAKAKANTSGVPSRVHESSRIKTVTGPKATRQETVEAGAFALPDDDGGSAMTLTLTLKGPTKPGQTVAKALRGKKPPGQVPEGSAGVLWMDLSQPPWVLQCSDADPARVFWMGMNLASGGGVWHSFYGQKGITPEVERAYVGFPEPHPGLRRIEFDGRFATEEERCWSAAVLRFGDGLVVFEHPSPRVVLPFEVLQWLTALEGYDPMRSLHRFAASDTSLPRRIEDAHRRLCYLCGIEVAEGELD